jgi:hypothetical protein
MKPRSPAKPQHCTASAVTTSALQRPATARSLSTVPILRRLQTGCTATLFACCAIATRASTVSWTNSMLSWICRRPARNFFMR